MVKIGRKTAYIIAALLPALIFTSCTSGGKPSVPTSPGSNVNVITTTDSGVPVSTGTKGSRSNEIHVLKPTAGGVLVKENSVAIVDYSNNSEGYICVKYTGTSQKVKLRITGPDEVQYTYDISIGDYSSFPLTGGNGIYNVGIYENIQDTEYSTAFYDTIEVAIADELKPYLYPNHYVYFDENSTCVSYGATLVESADSDLDAVSLVYNYIIQNITYDYAKAESPPTGYVSDVDETLATGQGICLDYAAVMVCMLRSQGIPTRLEVGYASDAYHAWLSVYIEDRGWINGVVEFTGNEWTLVDPTFGANTDEGTLKKFIGDGTNYVLQKIY